MRRPLNPREEHIVRLICAARENKEIAYLLSIAEGTVGFLIKRICGLTGTRNRVALAMWAVKTGLYDPRLLPVAAFADPVSERQEYRSIQ